MTGPTNSGFCRQCNTRIATPICPKCGSKAKQAPTPKNRATGPTPAASPHTAVVDQTASAVLRSARTHAGWTLIAGAVLAGIGIGSFAYSHEAGGRVLASAALAGALIMFRGVRRLWRLGARWTIPAVVIIVAMLTGVWFSADNAGKNTANRANDLSVRYIHRDGTRLTSYTETDLAQHVTAVCQVSRSAGGGVLVLNRRGDFGITDPRGVSHEPSGTPLCTDASVPRGVRTVLADLAATKPDKH
jgi:hypothetical protein